MSNDDYDYERGSPWWILVTVIIAWAILYYAALGVYYQFFHPCSTVKAQSDGLADRWTVQRHKYHGIHTSVYDPATGEAWFINKKGQRCRL